MNSALQLIFTKIKNKKNKNDDNKWAEGEMKIRFDRLLLVLIIAFTWLNQVTCKENYELKGSVLDALTKEALYQAVVIIDNKTVSTTDKKGHFHLMVTAGDSICFSHLAYISPSFYLSKEMLADTTRKVFYISTVAFEIREVKVFPFNDYASFKRDFLNKETSTVLNYTIKHTESIRNQIDNGYKPAQDACSNYRIEIKNQIKPREPGYINLFSTQNGSGIGALIKSLRKQ